jgi:hypothetical protein
MLASASKDASALIWRVTPAGEAILMHTLAGHAKPVVFLAWSPDDCRLLTCCSGQEARAAAARVAAPVFASPGRSLTLVACTALRTAKSSAIKLHCIHCVIVLLQAHAQAASQAYSACITIHSAHADAALTLH